MQIGLLEKRVNCWAHAIRLIDVQLFLIKDKEVRSCVLRDICCVQLSNSESIFNNVEWESSICSCFNWHKNLKCEHVISLATRLKLADFMTIAYSTPIGRKNKLGRPQMTHFLERDKDEEDNGYGNGVDDAYGVDISEPESDPEPEPEPTLIVRAKRGRPSKADIKARKTLSTTTTTTPNRAPKRSKKY